MKTLSLISLLSASAFAGDSLSISDSATHCPTGHEGHHDHSQHHDPIGVMGSHTHKKGEWMTSYRYMFMRMEQNYDGDSQVADSTVLGDYMVSPQDMDMEMHMLGLMYAPTDRLTLMGMINYVQTSMNHVNRMGVNFKTESSGWGDASLGGLYQIYSEANQQAHVGLMALLPTADIDNRDETPLGDSQLPYPMQSGSGSWGIHPSLTWTGHSGAWSYGSQISAKFYLTDNDNDYRLGDRYEGTLWGARSWTNGFSTSLRLSVSHWKDIEGSDPDIVETVSPMGMPIALVPTADTSLRGGTRIDASVGASFALADTGARLGVEFGVPLYQNLDGPQLGVEWTLTTGLQFAF